MLRRLSFDRYHELFSPARPANPEMSPGQARRRALELQREASADIAMADNFSTAKERMCRLLKVLSNGEALALGSNPAWDEESIAIQGPMEEVERHKLPPIRCGRRWTICSRVSCR
ncbi:hypothetical protein GCM10007160_21490 [Litchfieldella qijiaojingensis]|uniref:Uncharacterized protein n=1 Tax=Litchfieldella qijiaojingensis TaxID=980347 RepID=A0ABQ2YUA7_9GAMM|nr:hypothetical protein GCM10007160_21490 [Halomonas qijiaojingensis]